MKKLIAIVVALAVVSISANAQSGDKFWSPVKESTIQLKGKRQIIPQKYLTVALNGSSLKNMLFSAPNENAVAIEKSTCIVSLPLPNGSFQRFYVVESPITEPGFAAQYPTMKAFSVRGIDDVYANGKLDWTEFGFHGMIRTPNGDFFVDPYCVSNTTDYITYYTADFVKEQTPEVGVITANDKATPTPQKKSGNGGGVNNRTTASSAVCVGDELRKYRLAIACTGEYAVAATGLASPTKAQTLARIYTSVNRVDGVYESEVAVRVILIANDSLVVFTNPGTDPFTGNNNSNTLINESHTVITATIGTLNFDIGHTFSTGGGGLAYQGCVCNNTDKGRGITGSDNPVGDPYDIDYVAHEMGHQFGGSHTFNATSGSCGGGNRNASTAVEPGSGVTIMAYGGICGATDNLAAHSIPYFHGTSYDELVNYTHPGAGGNTCAQIAASPSTAVNASNQPPVVTSPGDFTVPGLTAFVLTGSATDPDNDPLTYSWEEVDPGPVGGQWNIVNTAPYFRSYTPTITPTRYFPNQTVMATGNYTLTRGERLPNVPQDLHFRLTARDNRQGGGGVCSVENIVTIDTVGGPFEITYPTLAGIVWGSGTQNVVTWNAGNTPSYCGSVRILISLDNNATYSVLLATTVNDGTEMVTVPTVSSNVTTCRMKVQALDGNIFYDISNKVFTIAADVGFQELSQNNPVGLAVWPNPFNEQFNFAAANLDGASTTKLTIIDMLGKPVMQADYPAKSELKETVDLSGISPGVYFVKVSNNNKQSVYRIIKN